MIQQLKILRSDVKCKKEKTLKRLFKQPKQELNYDLKIKLDGKRLHPGNFKISRCLFGRKSLLALPH